MAEPFKEEKFKKPNFFQKIFKIQPKDNAIIELNNKLAQIDKITQLSPEDIEEISRKYGFNILKKRKELIDLFFKYVYHTIKDKKLTDEEIENIIHLKSLFNLNDRDIKNEAKFLFKVAVDKVYRDDYKLEKHEKELLDKIEKILNLPEDYTTSIITNTVTSIIRKEYEKKISDLKLSPEEEQELNQLIINLGLNPNNVHFDKDQIQQLRYYWYLDNAPLEQLKLDVDINLFKKEVCVYWEDNVAVYQYKTRTKRLNYSGPQVRIRIMKGVYYSVGSYDVKTVKEEYLDTILYGTLYLTNKRLIIIGDRGAKTFRLSSILTSYVNDIGIEIVRNSGKNIILGINSDKTAFSILLNRMLKES